MDLAGSWGYLSEVAKRRLENNKTPRHVTRYGPEIELLGAAGELTARRFLGLDEHLHTTFDGGSDLSINGYTVDVKATRLTHRITHLFLQWPKWKPVKADIILLTVVDLSNKSGVPIGWVLREEIEQAPINWERDYPCHEIPISKLKPLWELIVPGFTL